MPQETWSAKREWQYGYLRDGLNERARSDETAARTGTQVRAQSGDAETANPGARPEMSPGRRRGLHSHGGAGAASYRQLYGEARARGIDGRSRMSKAQLEQALAR